MKKIMIMLFCVLLTSCTPKETETIQYSKEFSVGQLEREYLPEGMILTSLSTNTITVTSKAQSNIDNVNCKLDFSTCEGEGVCTVYVQCDREVKVSDRVIEVGIEYLYDPFSTIPEFSNNFTDGEYHVSEEYPMLLTIQGYCKTKGDIHIGNNWVDCKELDVDLEEYYVEYSTELMYPNYNYIYTMLYYDAWKDPDSHKYVHKSIHRDPNYKYLWPEHLEFLTKAMYELEIISFYPSYMHYYYNEEGCKNRYFSFIYELDGDEPYALDGDKVIVSVTQYEDQEVAFVEVDSPDKNNEYSYNAYVRVHDFFKYIDEMMIESNTTNYAYGCPIENT